MVRNPSQPREAEETALSLGAAGPRWETGGRMLPSAFSTRREGPARWTPPHWTPVVFLVSLPQAAPVVRSGLGSSTGPRAPRKTLLPSLLLYLGKQKQVLFLQSQSSESLGFPDHHSFWYHLCNLWQICHHLCHHFFNIFFK